MPEKNEIKIIIDTNIWISFLIGKRLSFLKELITNQKVKLVICEQLLVEINRVTSRPKVSKYFPTKSINDLINLLTAIGEYHYISSVANICRDPKDNFLLDLCVESKADYLVTSDKDLLILKNYNATKIISVKGFEELF